MTDHSLPPAKAADAERLAEIRRTVAAWSGPPQREVFSIVEAEFLLRQLDAAARPHDARFVSRAMYDAAMVDKATAFDMCAERSARAEAAERRVAEMEAERVDKATALDMLTARTAERDRLAVRIAELEEIIRGRGIVYP